MLSGLCVIKNNKDDYFYQTVSGQLVAGYRLGHSFREHAVFRRRNYHALWRNTLTQVAAVILEI